MPRTLHIFLLACLFLVFAGHAVAEDPLTAPTRKNGLQLVKMAVVKNKKEMVKAQPITQDIVNTIENSDKKTRDNTQISYGLVKDPKNRVLIMQASGRSYCGSTGCATHVFLDAGDGRGMEKVMNINAGGMIYAFDNGGAIALVFCTSRGTAVWEIQNNDFVLKGALNEPPACY